MNRIFADVTGGLAAAVVALPLALAFGVASGLGPLAGLYGAIAVGFFAAAFGGTPAQVSGPTGPITIVMAGIVAQYADRPETAFAIVLLGGVMQALFGLIRVGRYISYTPYSVISGFMSGIGLIIIILQSLPLLGMAPAADGVGGTLHAWPAALTRPNMDALFVGGAALAIMIVWPDPLRRYLPPPLAALIAGTVLGTTILPDAPTIGAVPMGLPAIDLPFVTLEELPSIIQPAFILALLGSIDSLLTSLVADSVTRTHHNSDRELIGQGIGNMAASLLGALPGAGATMRTMINIRAGGTTRLSGMTHAAVLLVFALGLAPVAEIIPQAALAGILMKVGWDIIDRGYLRRVRAAPRDKVVVMFVTLLLTVFVDLVTAVTVGLILAGFATARWMEREELKGITALALPEPDTHGPADFAALQHPGEDIMAISLRGRFSYASARELTKRVGAMRSGCRVLVLDFSDAAHMDTSAAMAVDEIIDSARSQQVDVILAGLSGTAEATLKSLGVLDDIAPGNLVATGHDSIRRARELLQTAAGSPRAD